MTFEISRLNNQFDRIPKPYPLNVIVAEIRKGTSSLHDLHDKALARNVREATQHARELLKTNHHARYDQIKKDMPQIMPALITESRSPADDVAFSKLVCIEYDDEDVDADYAIYLFSQNPHVVLAWRSLSGKPKALISVADHSIDGEPLNFTTFAHAWLTAAIMFEEIGDADIGAMRPTQTQNLCHDPNLYHNPNPIQCQWSIDPDALAELEETAYKDKRKPTIPGSISKLDPRYLDAIADIEFNHRGHGKTMLPCLFAYHEHDDWDNRFKKNATRITKHKNGDITLRCFKCNTSKKFFARQDTEVTSAIIEQAPPVEVRDTASFRHFTPEEKITIRAMNEDPDAGWIPAGDKNIPAWIPKYQHLHGLTGEFALNGQPPEVERRRVWLSEFTTCDHCGSLAAKWIDRFLITTGKYCGGCHKDYPIGSYLEYELRRKLPNSVISTSDARYLSDDPEFADFRLWEPGVFTYLASAMGTGKSTEIYKLMARLAQQGIGKGIIAVPRISLARFLAHYLRRKDGYGAWGLWHEGAPPSEKFIGKYGAICCVPSLPAVLAEAEGNPNAYIAIDEIDFAYSLLSLTVAQATKVKQILREAVATTGLVVAGQTESTLALEAFAAEVEADHVQGFYKNATPSDHLLTVYQYPDVEGKNNLILAGAEAAIATALAAEKNVYAFCTTRREAEILEAHFKHLTPVLYDAYTKGYADADAVLRNQGLTESQLFIATSAAGIGISILDENAHTVQIATLNFGTRNLSDRVQELSRDRGRRGGSVHLGEYPFRLPVKPTENFCVSLYHERLKAAEDAYVHLPEHSIRKIAAADALSTLADTQPATFLTYHLGEVAQMPLTFEDAGHVNAAEFERIKTTRSELLKSERAKKRQEAIAFLENSAVFSEDEIRKRSNTGKLLKSERLAQELANMALQSVGWTEAEEPSADSLDMAKALIEVSGVTIENLEKQRRGFYAVQFPTWTAHALIADREFAYRELVTAGEGVELTSVTDDRFIGELLKALLGKLAGVPWTAAGFADAVREILHSEVTDHEGCRGRTFMDNLLRGAAGARLYRTSRFLNLADDAGIIKWTSQLISEWYPARVAKRGDAYGLQRHEHDDLILQCFRLWGDQQLHPPDRWDIHAYETADLPDPNAEAKKQAREMRKAGKAFSEIAEVVGFPKQRLSEWCKGIDKDRKKRENARQMDANGMNRKDIAAALGISVSKLRRLIGKKAKK